MLSAGKTGEGEAVVNREAHRVHARGEISRRQFLRVHRRDEEPLP
jgi:hypothetical protein